MNDDNHLHQDYTDIAADYDKQRFTSPNGQFLARTDSAILRNLVRITRAKEVIDVPVGTGRVAKYLQQDRVKVVGCDITRAMMEYARSSSLDNLIGLIQCNASSLPFMDSSADCVICLRFFHLFPPQKRALFVSEFERVVRPGGYLIVSFTNGWYAGGINWLAHVFGRQTVYFQYPNEMRTLFPRWKILAIRGNFLPFQFYLSKLGEKIESALFYSVSRWPLNKLCYERFYLLKASK